MKERSWPEYLERHKKYLEKQKDYVVSNKNALKQKYGGKCIAVRNCKVIDSDKNQVRLLRRTYKQYPRSVVLVSTIEECVNPSTAEVPSPECK